MFSPCGGFSGRDCAEGSVSPQGSVDEQNPTHGPSHLGHPGEPRYGPSQLLRRQQRAGHPLLLFLAQDLPLSPSGARRTTLSPLFSVRCMDG